MKEVTTVITCDTCGKDISPKVTRYPREDILKVTCLNVALSDVLEYSLAMPILENDLYFCALPCMVKYPVHQ